MFCGVALAAGLVTLALVVAASDPVANCASVRVASSETLEARTKVIPPGVVDCVVVGTGGQVDSRKTYVPWATWFAAVAIGLGVALIVPAFVRLGRIALVIALGLALMLPWIVVTPLPILAILLVTPALVGLAARERLRGLAYLVLVGAGFVAVFAFG